MDVFVNILFWIHLGSLGVGGAAVFGIPVVGSQMASATAETRPVLFKVAKGLSGIGRAALLLLLITGPLMVWLRFGGVSGMSFWFWIKMVLVLILIAVVVFAGMNAAKAEKGDREAAMRAPMIGMAGIVVYLLVIFSAVFAFN